MNLTKQERSLLEAVVDIAHQAGYSGFITENSRISIDLFIDWAYEFEEIHKNEEWGLDLEYLDEIYLFAEDKFNRAILEGIARIDKP